MKNKKEREKEKEIFEKYFRGLADTLVYAGNEGLIDAEIMKVILEKFAEETGPDNFRRVNFDIRIE